MVGPSSSALKQCTGLPYTQHHANERLSTNWLAVFHQPTGDIYGNKDSRRRSTDALQMDGLLHMKWQVGLDRNYSTYPRLGFGRPLCKGDP